MGVLRLPSAMVCDVDALTYRRVRDFKVLLSLIDSGVAFETIEWLEENAPPSIPGTRRFQAPVPQIALGVFSRPMPSRKFVRTVR
jgi:hypothetical protein